VTKHAIARSMRGRARRTFHAKSSSGKTRATGHMWPSVGCKKYFHRGSESAPSWWMLGHVWDTRSRERWPEAGRTSVGGGVHEESGPRHCAMEFATSLTDGIGYSIGSDGGGSSAPAGAGHKANIRTISQCFMAVFHARAVSSAGERANRTPHQADQ
jgi:hypothetical protein